MSIMMRNQLNEIQINNMSVCSLYMSENKLAHNSEDLVGRELVQKQKQQHIYGNNSEVCNSNVDGRIPDIVDREMN